MKTKDINQMNGMLLIDKPMGMTSHDVVYKIRRYVGQKSVGHAGTLDPLASGLLVILLGEATKLSSLILNGRKSYQVGVKLGIDTDTWDTDGAIIHQEPFSKDPREVEESLHNVVKNKEFPLPIYSAVKLKGKKLYEYARENIQVEVPHRPMSFFDVENFSMPSVDEVTFHVSCLKGGYIRSLAHSLGKGLGSHGVVNRLRRTNSVPFCIEDSIKLNDLLEFDKENLSQLKAYKSIENILGPYSSFTVGGRDEKLMRNGAIPNDLQKRLVYTQKCVNNNESETFVKVYGAENYSLISLLHLRPKTKMKVFRRFIN